MSKQWITVKEVTLKNNCPECYNNEGLELTFKQEYVDTFFFKSVTQKVSTQLHCNTCDTAIYPVRWTHDLERIYEYQLKAFQPKKTSRKYKPLFWILVGLSVTVIATTLFLLSGYKFA